MRAGDVGVASVLGAGPWGQGRPAFFEWASDSANDCDARSRALSWCLEMGRPVFDQRELTVLFSAVLLACATAYFRKDVQRVPHWRLLLAGVACLMLGSTATIVEHFWAYDAFNTIEHAMYLAQSSMLLLWAVRVRRVAA